MPRIILTIPQKLLERVDALATSGEITRSEFIRSALHEHCLRNEEPKENPYIPKEYKNRQEELLSQPETPKNLEEETPKIPTPVAYFGYCGLRFEQGVEQPLREISYEDENGNEIWKKNICDRCIKDMKQRVQSKGGALYEGGVKI